MAEKVTWQAAVHAAALHTNRTDWREICRRTGLTESQWKTVRAEFNRRLKET